LKKEELNERSAVLVENSVTKDTFYDLNYQITNIEILKNILIDANNRDIAISFRTYKKKTGFKIINL
jgi:DNA polymerase-3 subunit epsilon